MNCGPHLTVEVVAFRPSIEWYMVAFRSAKVAQRFSFIHGAKGNHGCRSNHAVNEDFSYLGMDDLIDVDEINLTT